MRDNRCRRWISCAPTRPLTSVLLMLLCGCCVSDASEALRLVPEAGLHPGCTGSLALGPGAKLAVYTVEPCFPGWVLLRTSCCSTGPMSTEPEVSDALPTEVSKAGTCEEMMRQLTARAFAQLHVGLKPSTPRAKWMKEICIAVATGCDHTNIVKRRARLHVSGSPAVRSLSSYSF
ncbi:hypothetical protein V8C86DRAFT_2604877, partial [Haematococcus lacustris]